jgi:uncharacterized protein
VARWLTDTGPLIAYFDASDRHHAWSCEVFNLLTPPIFTCDAVVTEAFHMLRALPPARDRLLEMIERRDLAIVPVFPAEAGPVRKLLAKYGPRMDLADACLVRLTESQRDCRLLTLDSDFQFYRRHSREPIPLLAPFSS